MKKLIVLGMMLVTIVPLVLLSCQAVHTQATARSFWLKWTAPGDDDFVGQVTSYQRKYSESADSLRNNFTACRNWPEAVGPRLSPANARDSVRISGTFPTGVALFFAIKGVDEVGNVANISNIWDTTFTDTTKPAPITDLGTE